MCRGEPLGGGSSSPDAPAPARGAGTPALGIIKPIENEAACSSAACHAHSPSRRLLGVEAVHELGHAAGLVHCPVPRCPMHAALSPEALEQRDQRHCPARLEALWTLWRPGR